MLVTKGRLQTESVDPDEEAAAQETGAEPTRGPSVLTPRAHRLIEAVRARYAGDAVSGDETSVTAVGTRTVGLKSAAK